MTAHLLFVSYVSIRTVCCNTHSEQILQTLHSALSPSALVATLSKWVITLYTGQGSGYGSKSQVKTYKTGFGGVVGAGSSAEIKYNTFNYYTKGQSCMSWANGHFKYWAVKVPVTPFKIMLLYYY